MFAFAERWGTITSRKADDLRATPGDFVRAFRSGVAAADEVVAILLSGGPSGTFHATQAAVKAANLDRVRVVDGRTVSLGLGMLALRAAELAESGWTAAAIVSELDRVRSQSGLLLTVDSYDNLLRSGRVSRGKAWLAGMLDGIAPARAGEVAERLRTALVAAYRPRDCFVAFATGVLGTHVGLGAWAVFFQVEDGTPSRPPVEGRA